MNISILNKTNGKQQVLVGEGVLEMEVGVNGSPSIAVLGQVLDIEQSKKLRDTLDMAIKVASGEITFSRYYRPFLCPCTISGMGERTYGYVYNEALYKDEKGNFYLDSKYCPVSIPRNNDIKVFRGEGQKYFVDFSNININEIKLKQPYSYDILIQADDRLM